MSASRMIWFGRYEGWLRMVARGVRDGDKECIRKAAQLFDVMLPDQCIVIPMPSHTGRADRMHDVMTEFVVNGKGRIGMDVLRCNPHESNYSQKKYGAIPTPVAMWAHEPSDDMLGFIRMRHDIPVFVIDNVICSGVTASAALHALGDVAPNATVCALAYSTWRRHVI